MDVDVQVVLKLLEHCKGYLIRVATICGRSVIVAQLLDLSEALPFIVVLVHHGLDRVFDRAEAGCIQGFVVLFCPYHFADKWEKHQFLLFHMHGEFAGTCNEQLVYLQKLRVFCPVYLD